MTILSRVLTWDLKLVKLMRVYVCAHGTGGGGRKIGGTQPDRVIGASYYLVLLSGSVIFVVGILVNYIFLFPLTAQWYLRLSLSQLWIIVNHILRYSPASCSLRAS